MNQADDKTYMKMALSLAKKGIGTTSPNPMVGAVVVKDGQVVGQGYHKKAGAPHAEVLALSEAQDKARGATLYVTLEPCNHQGRTPACTRAVLTAKITRVVAATKDPNPDVAGGGLAFLSSQGVEVSCGLLEADAKKLNEFFIKHVTTGLPFIIAKCAATLDGQIASATGDSKWVTNEKSRRYVHKLRHGVDAIMVGINTVKADDPSLTTRLKGKKGIDPLRVILDSNLSIAKNARLLHQDSDSDTLIFTGQNALQQKIEALQSFGALVVQVPEADGYLDLGYICRYLGENGVTSLMIEGGGRVHASAMKAGIVDKVCFFYAPKIMGGNDGVPMFAGPGPKSMADCMRLADVSVRRFGEDIMVEGYLKK